MPREEVATELDWVIVARFLFVVGAFIVGLWIGAKMDHKQRKEQFIGTFGNHDLWMLKSDCPSPSAAISPVSPTTACTCPPNWAQTNDLPTGMHWIGCAGHQTLCKVCKHTEYGHKERAADLERRVKALR